MVPYVRSCMEEKVFAASKFEDFDELSRHVLARARALFSLDKYEDAASAFTHCMILTEREHPEHMLEYLEWRGVMMHNIASCYHHMLEFDVALMYYEFAAHDFEEVVQKASWHSLASAAFIGGGVNLQRLQFVKQRLEDVHCSRLPAKGLYLDAHGNLHTSVIDEDSQKQASACALAAEDLCSRHPTPLTTIPNALRRIPASSRDCATGIQIRKQQAKLQYFISGHSAWFASGEVHADC